MVYASGPKSVNENTNKQPLIKMYVAKNFQFFHFWNIDSFLEQFLFKSLLKKNVLFCIFCLKKKTKTD